MFWEDVSVDYARYVYLDGSSQLSFSIWCLSVRRGGLYLSRNMGARCRATFEEDRMSAWAIGLKVMYRVQLLTIVSVSKKASAMLQSIILNILGISRCLVTPKKGRWVK